MRADKLASKLGVVLCAVAMFGCDAAQQSPEEGEAGAGASENALIGGCTPVDSIDSMPDLKDEDCDGKIDEDVDFTVLSCPIGSKVIKGTRGNDVINGTSGSDCIFGYGGNDTINGKGGGDFIAGGPGDDQLTGGGGRDTMHGGKGNDRVDATGCGSSQLYGEDGADTLLGSGSGDKLSGGNGNDVVMGGSGADTMFGGGCNDLMIGGKNFDTANGDAGRDVCDAELKLTCEVTTSAMVACTTNAQCGTGKCAQNVGFCVPSSVDACNTGCVATAGTDTTCDGVDDDCDGLVDDEYASVATSCGVGGCASTGSTMCVSGSVVNSCTPGTPAASDTTCNSVDDDCDGLVDDNYASVATSCGVGLCASTGSTSCVGGSVVDSCVAGTPAANDATCNGDDDDCDGSQDEDFVSAATSCGVGACASTGSTSCVSGSVVDSCTAGAPAANDASCNGVDDDCNGDKDEDFVSEATSCGAGACTAAGATSCSGGVVSDSCTVTCEGACADTLDDDNDGLIDCADDDCAADSACAPTTNPYIGLPCTDSSECGPGGQCETAFPGGYCFVPCDADVCPSGSVCWLGTACVLPCGEGGTCSDPRLTCGGFEAAGLPPDPLCHPTCLESCVNGGTCDPDTSLCF